MLKKIQCDAFICENKKREPIIFNEGLNIILGNSEGTNSIGKTTILYIIDFCYGGDDYINKCENTISNIGDHIINFHYIFDDENYFFSRSTNNYKIISICDNNYNELETMKIEDFRDFLLEKYKIEIPEISFRSIISKYFRIYRRDNSDENKPLKTANGETEEKQIINLIKLFNYYKNISEIQKKLNYKKEELTIFKKAQKLNLLTKITKTEYKKINKEIENLIEKRYNLLSKYSKDLFNVDAKNAEILAELKRNYIELNRRLGSLKSELKSLVKLPTKNKKSFTNDLEKLKLFFTNFKYTEIEELELFHQDTIKHLNEYFEEERNRLEILIEKENYKINLIKNEINSLGVPTTISQAAFDENSELSKQIEQLTIRKKTYEDLEKLKQEFENLKIEFEESQKIYSEIVKKKINNELIRLNNYIYGSNSNPPFLDIIKPSKYIYSTPNDLGTGIAHKGLILFDLASLFLTPLPALIHDSFIFNNIAPASIEKIINIYLSSRKQIFISIDKINNFSIETKELINRQKVLSLSSNNQSLFGKSWSINKN